MTPPLGQPKLSVNTSNYTDYNSLESINTGRVSFDTGLGGTLSFDCGTDTKITDNVTTTPFIEAKYQQKLGEVSVFDKPLTFKGYVRYRNAINDYQQLRFSAGTSLAINDNLSLYANGHYTTNLNNNNEKAGFWVGAEYKIDDHWSTWVEPYQLNVDLTNGNCAHMSNMGVTYKF